MTEKKEYTLKPEDRKVIDEIALQIGVLNQQRAGMLLLLARQLGITNASIDGYDNGILTITRKGE